MIGVSFSLTLSIISWLVGLPARCCSCRRALSDCCLGLWGFGCHVRPQPCRTCTANCRLVLYCQMQTRPVLPGAAPSCAARRRPILYCQVQAHPVLPGAGPSCTARCRPVLYCQVQTSVVPPGAGPSCTARCRPVRYHSRTEAQDPTLAMDCLWECHSPTAEQELGHRPGRLLHACMHAPRQAGRLLHACMHAPRQAGCCCCMRPGRLLHACPSPLHQLSSVPPHGSRSNQPSSTVLCGTLPQWGPH
jgi:hypothetical protein